jgi:hypothetical protein
MATALADPRDLQSKLKTLPTVMPTSLSPAQGHASVVDSDLLAGLKDRATGGHVALHTSP